MRGALGVVAHALADDGEGGAGGFGSTCPEVTYDVHGQGDWSVSPLSDFLQVGIVEMGFIFASIEI